MISIFCDNINSCFPIKHLQDSFKPILPTWVSLSRMKKRKRPLPRLHWTMCSPSSRFAYSMRLACVVSLNFTKQETESALQSSIFARRVMAEVYLHDQDYPTTITVSEAGLELANRHRDDSCSDLALYVIPQCETA